MVITVERIDARIAQIMDEFELLPENIISEFEEKATDIIDSRPQRLFFDLNIDDYGKSIDLRDVALSDYLMTRDFFVPPKLIHEYRNRIAQHQH